MRSVSGTAQFAVSCGVTLHCFADLRAPLHCAHLPAGEQPATSAAASDDAASWHLESVEVAPQGQGAARPVYFACGKWLDARSGHRAELSASRVDPRLAEVEYKARSGAGVHGAWPAEAGLPCSTRLQGVGTLDFLKEGWAERMPGLLHRQTATRDASNSSHPSVHLPLWRRHPR